MDVLEQVRDIDLHDDTTVTDTQINTARQALLREIASDQRPGRARRRWIGGTGLVAGAAAVAVAMSALAPARVDPAAAEVLDNAADVTIAAMDTTLVPGQYLRIQTEDDTLWKWDVGMGAASERFNNGDRADADAGIVVGETRVLYVPADRSSDWIWDWSVAPKVIATYGADADQAVVDWKAREKSSDSGYWSKMQVLPGGETPAAQGDSHQYLLDSYRPFYAKMPRAPKALLAWFREFSGDPNVRDQWVVDAMTGVLSANLMPADLRAAMLRALALIPGIRVTHVAGDSTTLEYQSGDWLWTRTTQITLDTKLGMITGLAQSDSNNIRGPGAVPATVPDSRTLVTTTIVDSAPKP